MPVRCEVYGSSFPAESGFRVGNRAIRNQPGTSLEPPRGHGGSGDSRFRAESGRVENRRPRFRGNRPVYLGEAQARDQPMPMKWRQPLWTGTIVVRHS